MAKRYGLNVITLKAKGRSVQWMPQRGAETKQGAKHYRTGLRQGFEGFTCVAPTRKYIDDYEAGYREGDSVAEKAGTKQDNRPEEVKHAEELIARHKFAVQQGDDVHTKNVEGDVMDYGDKLMRQAGGMAEFAAVVRSERSAFRREMKRQDNAQAKALTMLFDYCDEAREDDVTAFIKYVPMPTEDGYHQKVTDIINRSRNAQAPSLVHFRVGLKVRVMNKTPDGREIVEGMATIKKVNQGDHQGVHAEVEFDDEPGQTYERWVFAKYQDAELELIFA